MLPLDLHVLGLPLAFILSQDQTLRCKNFEFCCGSFNLNSYAVSFISQYFKELSFVCNLEINLNYTIDPFISFLKPNLVRFGRAKVLTYFILTSFL